MLSITVSTTQSATVTQSLRSHRMMASPNSNRQKSSKAGPVYRKALRLHTMQNAKTASLSNASAKTPDTARSTESLISNPFYPLGQGPNTVMEATLPKSFPSVSSPPGTHESHSHLYSPLRAIKSPNQSQSLASPAKAKRKWGHK